MLNGHDHDYERFAPQDPSGHFYLGPHRQTVTILAGRTVTVDLVINSGLR